eukprot:48169-Chlamydomonas_euryale.AAC.3
MHCRAPSTQCMFASERETYLQGHRHDPTKHTWHPAYAVCTQPRPCMHAEAHAEAHGEGLGSRSAISMLTDLVYELHACGVARTGLGGPTLCDQM